MQHYFIEKEHNKSDYFDFTDEILGFNINFKSVDNVFSKNKIDDGTRVLLNAVAKQMQLSGDVLDFGCGLGTISITLKKLYPNINMHACDINSVAVELTKQNAKQNKIELKSIVKSNIYDNIDKNFDFIVTNPPIKVGKKILFEIIKQSFEHLNIGGKIVLVIRKLHGQESLKTYMNSLFNNVEILKRDKGYYIMASEKKGD